MSRVLAAEFPALFLALVALVIIGLLSGYWALAAIVGLGGYIIWMYARLDKLEQWIHRGTKVSQVYDDSGFIGTVIRQLHKQKKTHNQRKKRAKQILGRLNRNISALPDATVLLNSNLEIEWSNEPARYLLNVHSPQDLGHRIGNFIRNPDFLDYLQSTDSRDQIEIPAPSDPSITVHIRIVAMGGGQRLLIARNISDQKQLQESLKNFVANASHELKSPLTVISGHLEMLDGEPRLSDTGRASLRTAQRQAARMKELIQNLLLLSQVESYQLRPGEGDKISLLEVMTNTIAAMDKFDDRDRVSWDYPHDLFLLGIKPEIEGICINLVENALKYSAPGTPIEVSWRQNELGEYLFEVADRGPGIDSEELPMLTERYYRIARNSADITGSGLGLAIVSQAAAKHGASMEIDSEVGQGSRFRVIFPSYRCLREKLPTAKVFNLSDY